MGMRFTTNAQFTPVWLVMTTKARIALTMDLRAMEKVEPVVRNQAEMLMATQITSRDIDD